MASFRTGADKAQEAAKSSGGGAKFARFDYFRIPKEDKDKKPYRDIRFLTEFADNDLGLQAWITVAMHNSQPTRPAPAGYKGNWPQRMSAVCRNDKHDGQRTFPQFPDCCFCDYLKQKGGKHAGKPIYAADRTFALALLREEDGTRNPDGTPHLRDAMQTVKRTINDVETEVEEPIILLIVQAYSNFWGGAHGIAAMKGTALDRDYRVTRIGWEMNDTDYQIAPHEPQTCTWPDGRVTPLDFRDPEIRACYDIPDLAEIVEKQASDDYYARFFDDRMPQPAMDAADHTGGGPTVEPSAAIVTPTNDVTPERLRSLTDRINGVTGAQPVVQPVTQPVQPLQPAAAPAGTPFQSGGLRPV